MRYAGQRSTFSTKLRVPERGPVKLMVLAMDPKNANFGIAWREIQIGQKRKQP